MREYSEEMTESPPWKRQGEHPTLTAGKEIASSALESQNTEILRG